MKNKNPIYSILGLGSALMLVLAVVGCASSGTQVTQEQKFIRLHHVANTATLRDTWPLTDTARVSAVMPTISVVVRCRVFTACSGES
jgi:hypothetical protein